MTWWVAIPPQTRTAVRVDSLSFDDDNPRFTPEKRPSVTSDEAFVRELAVSADLAELISSISASGYVDIEPLIVIGRDTRLVVIEGNRRLAALKALRDPDLARRCKIAVPPLTKEVLDTLQHVSVYRVEVEDEARTLIGFKHINGPQVWDAYAKGRYAARWLDDERSKRDSGASGLTLADISRRMGDKNDTVHRIVSAVYVLEQAEREGLFDVADRATKNFSFSHLYTALTYTEYREFLGLPPTDRRSDPVHNPVQPANFPGLKKLLRWLYGSRSEAIDPVIRKQNPDIATLKKVLGDRRSLRVMLERNNLEEASESTIPSASKFENFIVDADLNLKSAQSALDGYDGQDLTLLEIAQSIQSKARVIVSMMTMLRDEYVDALDGHKSNESDAAKEKF